jgi:hypothetical protein
MLFYYTIKNKGVFSFLEFLERKLGCSWLINEKQRCTLTDLSYGPWTKNMEGKILLDYSNGTTSRLYEF